jgi:hypothetical protein
VSVFLQLLHGRVDPDAQMEGYGPTGPTLGPFGWVHTTYVNDVKLGDPMGGDALASLTVANDLIYYDGVWFGDWVVIDGGAAGMEEQSSGRKLDAVDPEKTTLPGTLIFGFDGHRIFKTPSLAFEYGSCEAEDYRRRSAKALAVERGCEVCITCYAAVGKERVDNGLPCGIHCQKCFDKMVHDCRQQSF